MTDETHCATRVGRESNLPVVRRNFGLMTLFRSTRLRRRMRLVSSFARLSGAGSDPGFEPNPVGRLVLVGACDPGARARIQMFRDASHSWTQALRFGFSAGALRNWSDLLSHSAKGGCHRERARGIRPARKGRVGASLALPIAPIQLILRSGARLAGVGLALGLLGAFAATRLLQQMLFRSAAVCPGGVRRGGGDVCRSCGAGLSHPGAHGDEGGPDGGVASGMINRNGPRGFWNE